MATTTLDKTARIRELNDHLRIHFGGGKIMLSASVSELGHEIKAAALMELRKFSDFTDDNDPHREHDFGSFELDGETVYFKVDCYNKTLDGGSENPADPDQTTRVLTIMLAEEY